MVFSVQLEPIFDQTRLPFSTSEITKRNTIVLAAPGLLWASHFLCMKCIDLHMPYCSVRITLMLYNVPYLKLQWQQGSMPFVQAIIGRASCCFKFSAVMWCNVDLTVHHLRVLNLNCAMPSYQHGLKIIVLITKPSANWIWRYVCMHCCCCYWTPIHFNQWETSAVVVTGSVSAELWNISHVPVHMCTLHMKVTLLPPFLQSLSLSMCFKCLQYVCICWWVEGTVFILRYFTLTLTAKNVCIQGKCCVYMPLDNAATCLACSQAIRIRLT